MRKQKKTEFKRMYRFGPPSFGTRYTHNPTNNGAGYFVNRAGYWCVVHTCIILWCIRLKIAAKPEVQCVNWKAEANGSHTTVHAIPPHKLVSKPKNPKA